MGIVAIVDILIAVNSIQVQVELHDSHIWQYTDLWCAAYPQSVRLEDDPSEVMNNVHVHGPSNTLQEMPPIHFDADGNQIQPGNSYWVKCRADEVWYGTVYRYFLHTVVTPLRRNFCRPGVRYQPPGSRPRQLSVAGPIVDGAVDLGHTNYNNFPSGVRSLKVFDVPRPLEAGSSLKLTCCRGRECEYWVTMYVCRECTGPREDGLQSNLFSNGWEPGSCSPKFDDNTKTVSFHKHIDANSADWSETIDSDYNEIAVVFGFEGSATSPWCNKGKGPVAPEVGTNGRVNSCGQNCPSPFNLGE